MMTVLAILAAWLLLALAGGLLIGAVIHWADRAEAQQ